MKILTIFTLAIVIMGLSSCGDGVAPPEVERAIRDSHSAKSRQKQQTSDPNSSTEQQSGKKGQSKSGNSGTTSPTSPQFVIIPGEATQTDK